MLRNELTELLKINYPILQAPMAGGITTPRLVSEVSNAGGLGMIGVGGMPANQMQEQIRQTKQLTSKSFGINLFVPEEFVATDEEVEATKEILAPLFKKLNIKQEDAELPTPQSKEKDFQEKVEMIVEEKVPVCSFIFGIPPKEVITKMKENGIIVIGTATTVREAMEVEKAGMDAVVMQGSEAGGHRGAFIKEVKDSLVGTMSLVPQAADCLNIPIIAAGGIMGGRGLTAALHLGALGVQMGTAFLTTEESGAHPLHKEAILNSEDQTVLTRSFTGKYARAIKNAYVAELEAYEAGFPMFPLHRSLTQPIVTAAKNQNNPDYMLLLSGQSTTLARKKTARVLIETMVQEASKLIK